MRLYGTRGRQSEGQREEKAKPLSNNGEWRILGPPKFPSQNQYFTFNGTYRRDEVVYQVHSRNAQYSLQYLQHLNVSV